MMEDALHHVLNLCAAPLKRQAGWCRELSPMLHLFIGPRKRKAAECREVPPVLD